MRFGLFTAAAPLAISDDSMFPVKKGKFQIQKSKPTPIIEIALTQLHFSSQGRGQQRDHCP